MSLSQDQKDRLQTEADALMNFSGQVRGAAIKVLLDYIQAEKGEGSIDEIEAIAEELGHPINWSSLKPYSYYLEAHSALTVLIAKFLYGWTKDDLRRMGEFVAVNSLLMRFALLLLSLETAFRYAPSYWKKHYDFGEIIPLNLDKENKEVRFQVVGYPYTELMGSIQQGTIAKILGGITGETPRSEIEPCLGYNGKQSCSIFVFKW